MTLFTETEFPYAELQRMGLTNEMIDDLPEAVMSDILNGHESPMLRMSFSAADGRTILFSSRFSLLRGSDGTVTAQLYPRCATVSKSMIPELGSLDLTPGIVYQGSIPDMNGELVKGYVQVDRETGRLMSLPQAALENNINSVARDLQLQAAEIMAIKTGTPITFIYKERPVTLGIDLKSKTRLRVVAGDTIQWADTAEREYDKYNFGLNGCWVEQEDGSLDYIDECDYTDDILVEQRKQSGEKQQSAARMGRS